ncbi:hypothetical protein ABL78_4118 [Leptomonas seymouri]|uniref:Uncharacterized protein n=1 Tax=Leptomonas seymouri TaxID=5684 RepID=A0A0N1HX16_LEPSE|nr:hypothetical protein ABL78_4118 [Leptomonas seymouri]|eukprot:KPI86794.1 hypothetical protein ABL78_4118 [Leptomonas seymouri]
MRRLYLSKSTEKIRASIGPSILVGQRSLLSVSSSVGAALYTVYVVAECVPCEGASVLEEQVECLERVLPFGVEVLGVSGSASEVADLVAQLHNFESKELVSVVHGDGHDKSRSCHLVSTPSNGVAVAESEVAFVEVRLALHSCETHLPFLVSSQGGSHTVVDGEGCLPLQKCVPFCTTGAQLAQLGAAASTLRIHVVLDPAFVSAKGLYDILRRQINDAIAAGTTRLVEVQSHNAHISYCCRVESDAASDTKELSSETLQEVFEMIEDATGAAVQHSDMRGCTSGASEKKASAGLCADAVPPSLPPPTAAQGTSAVKLQTGDETLLLFLGAAIVAIGVLVAMVW